MKSATGHGAYEYESRTELLADISDTLRRRSGCGVFVYGSAGMGKTTVARRLRAACRDNFESFLLVGTPTLRSVPFGALAPLLAEASPGHLNSPLAVLRIVRSFVRNRPGHRTVLLIIDDMHFLDQESAILLTQLASCGDIAIAGFAPSVTALCTELAQLAEDGLVEQQAMLRLTHVEVLALCGQVLGDDLARGVSSWFRRESAGNPLFLPALVDHAVRCGSLVVIDGVWVLKDTASAAPASLQQVARSIVLQLGALERTAFELVVLAEVVSLTDLVRLSSESAVSSLLQAGLLRRVNRRGFIGFRTRDLPDPIFRTVIPMGRRRTLLRRLGPGTQKDRTLPAPGRVRRALWELECGETVPDRRLLELAATAARTGEYRSALRLADAVRAPDRAADATRFSAMARFDPYCLHEVGRTEPASSAGASVHGRPVETPELRILRALWSNHAGRYSETIESLEQIVGEGSEDLRLLTSAHALLAEALGAVGRSVQARRHGSAALALIDDHPEVVSDLYRGAFLRHLSVVVHSGDLGTAEDALGEYTAATDSDYAFCSGSIAVLDAAVDVRKGRFRSGLTKIRPALVSLRCSDQDGLLVYGLGIGSWAAATLGEADQVEQWFAEFSSITDRGSAQNSVLAHALVAAARVIQGSGATSQLLGQAGMARENGWLTAEKEILELAVGLGDPGAPALLAAVTASLEGDEARVLHTYAASLASGDAEALAVTADRAESLQKYSLAVEATRQAMTFLPAGSSKDHRRELGLMVRRRRMLIDGGPVMEPVEPTTTRPLTPREREIALLAADGYSNRAIARHLVVSIRTIEGHLYRTFAKLGIVRREDLPGTMNDLLPAPGGRDAGR
ncbi:helix-turn-helix transcriptional regulator [Arthrobacter echini]|uniref:Helix-turn-helix transcriptional regulator n=1 Tax=Arthrobacter echini TaxID=1529066 RepID=A0A4S5E8L4_9MICC|nr:LuxR family transcriptional regulator [Arthrobacter echini]THJ67853.1 helix-turn-helix transcriptional regulator [Arthrobacter echini]